MSDDSKLDEVQVITGGAALVCAAAVVLPYFPAAEYFVNTVFVIGGGIAALVVIWLIVREMWL